MAILYLRVQIKPINAKFIGLIGRILFYKRLQVRCVKARLIVMHHEVWTVYERFFFVLFFCVSHLHFSLCIIVILIIQNNNNSFNCIHIILLH